MLYNCDNLAKPILHDTILQLTIDREVVSNLCEKAESESFLLLDNEEDHTKHNGDVLESGTENIQVTNFIIKKLQSAFNG